MKHKYARNRHFQNRENLNFLGSLGQFNRQLWFKKPVFSNLRTFFTYCWLIHRNYLPLPSSDLRVKGNITGHIPTPNPSMIAPVGFSFSVAGLLFPFHAGVIDTLAPSVLSPAAPINGASGGALAAACAAANFPSAKSIGASLRWGLKRSEG